MKFVQNFTVILRQIVVSGKKKAAFICENHMEDLYSTVLMFFPSERPGAGRVAKSAELFHGTGPRDKLAWNGFREVVFEFLFCLYFLFLRQYI